MKVKMEPKMSLTKALSSRRGRKRKIKNKIRLSTQVVAIRFVYLIFLMLSFSLGWFLSKKQTVQRSPVITEQKAQNRLNTYVNQKFYFLFQYPDSLKKLLS